MSVIAKAGIPQSPTRLYGSQIVSELTKPNAAITSDQWPVESAYLNRGGGNGQLLPVF